MKRLLAVIRECIIIFVVSDSVCSAVVIAGGVNEAEGSIWFLIAMREV